MSDIPSPRSQTGALNDSDDRRLLRAVAGGSERALLTLRQCHHADLLRFVRARMQGRASAEEVVADVFLAVWRRSRRDAVELVRASGKPVAVIAGEPGIYDSTLGNWGQAGPHRPERAGVDDADAEGAAEQAADEQ